MEIRGMELRHEALGENEANILRRHWNTLKSDIRMADISGDLIEKGVLRPEAWDEIKKSSNIERNQNEEFLIRLLKKPSNNFFIFREALREHGFQHLAEKLEVHDSRPKTPNNRQGSVKDESDAGGITDIKNLMKQIKDLDERDKARERQINSNKKEFEKKLEINLRKTNNELDKMRESLRQKEIEINRLKTIQSQQEEINRHLSMENSKLETEKEHMIEEIDNQKTKERKIAREREKLKKTIERQNTQIEELKREKSVVMENLQQKSTYIGDLQREKTDLIDQLESERALTARTTRTLYTPIDTWGLDRRQPTGISEDSVDQNDVTRSSDNEKKIKQVSEEIIQMKKGIKEKEELIDKLIASKSDSDVRNSQLCTIQ